MSNKLKACPTPRCHGVIFTLELVGGIRFKACCAGCEMTGPIGGSVCESTEFWNELPRKIKLTKTLPSEPGQYYWAAYTSVLPVIGEIDSQGDFYNEGSFMVASEIGGYWAKVEKDQLEFEG